MSAFCCFIYFAEKIAGSFGNRKDSLIDGNVKDFFESVKKFDAGQAVESQLPVKRTVEPHGNGGTLLGVQLGSKLSDCLEQ